MNLRLKPFLWFFSFLFLVSSIVFADEQGAVKLVHNAETANVDDTKISFSSAPSVTEIGMGEKFNFTFTIQYYGSDTYWHVKSISGPVITNGTSLAHSVSSSVKQENGQVVCEEIHKLTISAASSIPENQVLKISPVKVVLLGKNGTVRHLQSTAVEIAIMPGFLTSPITIPVSWIIALVSLLIIVLFLILAGKVIKNRSGGHIDSDKDDEAAINEKVTILLKDVEDMNNRTAFEDSKEFYKKTLSIIGSGFQLNDVAFKKGDVDDMTLHLKDIPNIPASLENGLRKVLQDEKLVRFAGLTPDFDECEQVCSRLKELVTLNFEEEL